LPTNAMTMCKNTLHSSNLNYFVLISIFVEKARKVKKNELTCDGYVKR